MARDYIDMVERRHQKKKWQTPKLVYYKDGIATTVSVDQWGKVFSMKNNGKVDASNDADMPTQISVGLLPLLLYNNDHAPKVALIGYGSGVTAGATTQYPIASLEVVELEPAIYEAAHFFDNVNHRPTENPKVKAIAGDGRNFLSQRRDSTTSSSASRRIPGSPACRTCSRASISSRSNRAWPTTASSASGRSSTKWRPGTSRPSTAPWPASSPT
jgi:hypothetical protein